MTAGSETDYTVWRYQEDLPADKENLDKAWRLLKSYSGIPSKKIEEHVREVREKAWAVFPYACIGRWRFLDVYLTATPEYRRIVSRIRAGDRFLDAGCCFGQILRQLAHDGAPAANLVGADLRREYIDLGYDLFKDRAKFGARFVAGDMLDPADPAMASLDGTVDIVHAASLFHLFDWNDQVALGARIVKFISPRASPGLVVGRQVGSLEAVDHQAHADIGLGRYHHNPRTLQELWDVIGEKTGTKWSVNAEMINLIPDSKDVKRVGIRFVITKL